MNEQGHYDVVLHTGPGLARAHATFPFGQWAEVGYWLDEIGAGEQDTLTVTFHPLRPPLREGRVTCPHCGRTFAWSGEEPQDCLLCGGLLSELHSVRAELHEGAGLLDLRPPTPVDMEAVARLEEFSRGLGEIDAGEGD